jgi:hypothetical protein
VIPTKQPSGQLKVVPLTDDANIAEQLAASLATIQESISNIGDGVLELLAKPGPRVVLTMDGPEPLWVKELREKHATAMHVGSSVCVVSRESVANMITLIERARHKR